MHDVVVAVQAAVVPHGLSEMHATLVLATHSSHATHLRHVPGTYQTLFRVDLTRSADPTDPACFDPLTLSSQDEITHQSTYIS